MAKTKDEQPQQTGLRRGSSTSEAAKPSGGVNMEMSAEEFLEHVKIDGCLTVEGKQYVEMKDVLLLIEMALEQNENALRNCLQIEISEEEFNNAEQEEKTNLPKRKWLKPKTEDWENMVSEAERLADIMEKKGYFFK